MAWTQACFEIRERRACRALEVARSSIRYVGHRPRQEALRQRITELSRVRTSFGYRWLHILLRREGWRINHKRVYRLYRDEGLGLRRGRPKRRRSAVLRGERAEASSPNEIWAMDFMHDALFDGRTL